jgi:hypothetical protein
MESRTHLTFYADREHKVVLRRFRGPPHHFRPFVVHVDTLYFEYMFDPRDPPCFGVRFTVSRLAGLWLEVRGRDLSVAASCLNRGVRLLVYAAGYVCACVVCAYAVCCACVVWCVLMRCAVLVWCGVLAYCAQEEKVLTEPSLEWGCWLLQFLLSKDVVRC